MGGMTGGPLRELTPQELRSWGEPGARLSPRRYRIAFPPLRDIPAEAHPSSLSKHPKLRVPAREAWSRPEAAWEAPPSLGAFSSWKLALAFETSMRPMPSSRQACQPRTEFSPEAFPQPEPSPGFRASDLCSVSRGGAWLLSRRMSRSGGNAIRYLRGAAALLIHPKGEALGVSIRLESNQAPPPANSVGLRADHLESA